MTTPITPAIQTEVANNYIAIFGRNPDPAGFGYWTNALANENNSAQAQQNLTLGFSASPEFQAAYNGLTTTQAVTQFYEFILNRAPDPSGLQYWSGVVNSYISQGFSVSQAYALTAVNLITVAAANTGTQDQTLILNKEAAAVAAGTASHYTLTTGQDIATANVFNATLTPALIAQPGVTLNSNDQLTGAGTNPTLNVTDDYNQNNDVLPAGLTLNNIQTINFNTAGNVGNGGTLLDTTPFSGVTALNVTSAGQGDDLINATRGSTNVTVQHNSLGGAVVATGGLNVNVTTNGSGGVTIGGGSVSGGGLVPTGLLNPTGTVTVIENSAGNAGVTVNGGSAVSVTVTSPTNTGAVTIGDHAWNAPVSTIDSPTGAVTVNDSGTGTISVFGGVGSGGTNAVTVTSAGGDVTVGGGKVAYGSGSYASFNPTGNVLVTETTNSAISGGQTTAAEIAVLGGVNVTINDSNGGAGTITVGDDSTLTASGGSNATGVITIADSATGNVTVYGGSSVSINDTSAGTGNIGVVSSTATPVTINSNNTGNVTVAGGLNDQVTITGSASGGAVSVTGAAGTVTISDSQAGAAVIVTGGTVDTVHLTGSGSGTINVSGATSSVTITDSQSGNISVDTSTTNATAVVITDTSTGSGAITVNAGANTATTIVDSANGNITVNNGTNVTVSDSGTGAITIDPPTGNISVTDSSAGSAPIIVQGGGAAIVSGITVTKDSVSVSTTNALDTSNISIGNINGINGATGLAATASDNAAGHITLTRDSTGGAAITDTIYGGGRSINAGAIATGVTANVQGDTVTVGDATAGTSVLTVNQAATTVGTVQTVSIGGTAYNYTVGGSDDTSDVAAGLFNQITGHVSGSYVINGEQVSRASGASVISVNGKPASIGVDATGNITATYGDAISNNTTGNVIVNNQQAHTFDGLAQTLTANTTTIGDVVSANIGGTNYSYTVLSAAGSGGATPATATTVAAGLFQAITGHATGSYVVNGVTVSYSGGTSIAADGKVTVGSHLGTASASNAAIGGDVTVYGGNDVNVTINTGGQVQIGADNIPGALATGNITLVDTATDLNGVFGNGNYADPLGGPNIMGGTNVTAVLAGAAVYIGVDGADSGPYTNLLDNPTGAVKVTETVASSQTIYVDGGNGVTVNALGQSVALGTYTGVNGAVVVNQGQYAAGGSGSATYLANATQYTGNALGSSNTDSSVTVDGGTSVTINTTGGDVFVGGSSHNLPNNNDGSGDGITHVPTGAVNITNTFSGALTANASTVDVLGGSTVTITETNATSGEIYVGGVLPTLNSGGTALANANLFATGNVTINNSTVSNGQTIYGTSDTIVRMNGGTTASITGGSVQAIVDIEQLKATSGGYAGQAVGTSHLTTVVLDGVQSPGPGTIIDSGALTNLTVADSVSTQNATKVIVGTLFNSMADEGAHALNLTLSNDSNAQTTVTDNTATSLVVNSAGTADNQVTFNSNDLTSATFNNASGSTSNLTATLTVETSLSTLTLDNAGRLDLTLTDTYVGSGGTTAVTYGGTGDLVLDVTAAMAVQSIADNGSGNVNLTIGAENYSLHTITDSGSGYLSISGAELAPALTSINASASTGGVFALINPLLTAFTGGSGETILGITQETTNSSQALDGGTYTGPMVNSLPYLPNLNYGNILVEEFDGGAGAVQHVTHFQTLAVGDLNLNTYVSGNYDATGFQHLIVANGSDANMAFTNVGANVDLTLLNSDIGVQLATYTGHDAMTFYVSVGNNGLYLGNWSSVAGVEGNYGIQSVTLNTGGDNARVELVDQQMTTLTITGAGVYMGDSFNAADAGFYAGGMAADSDVIVESMVSTNIYDGAGSNALASAQASLLTVIDAHTATGPVDLSAVNGSINGITILGGAGMLTAHGTLQTVYNYVDAEWNSGYINSFTNNNASTDVTQAQNTVTLQGNYAAGDTVTVVINGVTESITVSQSEVYTASHGVGNIAAITNLENQVALDLATQINADTASNFVTAVTNGNVVTYTAINPGVAVTGVDSSTVPVTTLSNTEALSITSSTNDVTYHATGGTGLSSTVDTITIGTVGASGSTVSVTFGGNTYTTTVTNAESQASIAAALVSSGSANSGGYVLTHLTGGNSNKFTVTNNTQGASGQIATVSAANSGVGSTTVIGDSTVSGNNGASYYSYTNHVDTLTISGGWTVGDTVTAEVNGTTYYYQVQATDIASSSAATDHNIAANLAYVIGNDSGFLTGTPIVSGSTLTLTEAIAPSTPSNDPHANQFTSAGLTTTNGAVDTQNQAQIVHNFTNAQDTITVGTGGGDITIGTGGGWNQTATFAGAPLVPSLVSYVGGYNTATGYEAIDLTASTVSDTINVFQGSVAMSNDNGLGGVTGFHIQPTANADVLNVLDTSLSAGSYALSNTTQSINVGSLVHAANDIVLGGELAGTSNDIGVNQALVLDPSGQLAAKLGYLNYTSENGVIHFAPTAGHSFTTAELVDAAQIIVDNQSTQSSAIFENSGNTYVVSSGNNGDSIAAHVTNANISLSANQLFFESGIHANPNYAIAPSDNGWAGAIDGGTTGAGPTLPTGPGFNSYYNPVQNVINAGNDTGWNGHWSGVETITPYDLDLAGEDAIVNMPVQVSISTQSLHYQENVAVLAVAHTQAVNVNIGTFNQTGYEFGDFAVTQNSSGPLTSNSGNGWTSSYGVTVGSGPGTVSSAQIYGQDGQVAYTVAYVSGQVQVFAGAATSGTDLAGGSGGSSYTISGGAYSDYFLSSYDAANQIVNVVNDQHLLTADGKAITAYMSGNGISYGSGSTTGAVTSHVYYNGGIVNTDQTSGGTVTNGNINTPNNQTVSVNVSNADTIQINLPLTAPNYVASTATQAVVTTQNPNSVVELKGVTGVTGFGSTSSVSSIVSNVSNNEIYLGSSGGDLTPSLGSTLAHEIYDATGWSYVGSSGGGFGTTDTVINNLAASAILDLDNSGASIGLVTIHQVAGSSITINATNAIAEGALALNGDWEALINAKNNHMHLASLSDGGLINSLTNLSLTTGDGGTLTIDAINDSALTTITGTVGDANGYESASSITLGSLATPLTQANLSIHLTGLVGEDNVNVAYVFTSGNGDSITLDITNSSDVAGYVTATGDHNIIHVTGAANVTANGLTDTITVGDYSTVTANGSGTSLATGDVITTGDGSIVNATGDYAQITTDVGPTPVNYSTVIASGNHDVISASYTGALITANGVSDTITATDSAIVAANGASDSITVGVDAQVHASGNGDVITLGAGSTLDGGALGTSIGANDTIAVGGGLSVTSIDFGTVTGLQTTGAYNTTTLSGVNFVGDIDLLMGSTITQTMAGGVGTSQVNVATASTLADALNFAAATAAASQNAAGTIAAHTGVIDWFQFGGNTYIVDAINGSNAAANHTALAAGDSVVKIVGLVDLSSELNVISSGHTLQIGTPI